LSSIITRTASTPRSASSFRASNASVETRATSAPFPPEKTTRAAAPGEQRGLHNALAVVEDGLPSRIAQNIIDRASENDDRIWRRHIGRGRGKPILQRRREQTADRRHGDGDQDEEGRDRDQSPNPGMAAAGVQSAEESGDEQQADRRCEHPEEFRRDKEHKGAPFIVCLWQGAALVASRAVA
jgi:hypothetical protein